METPKKLYIVAFGDSRQYRLEHAEDEPSVLAAVERQLNDYLRERFPGDTFAYFTTPKVTEIDWEHRDRYADYPELDDKAVAEIKDVLVKEVEDRASLQQLDSDAPYAEADNAPGVGTLKEV